MSVKELLVSLSLIQAFRLQYALVLREVFQL